MMRKSIFIFLKYFHYFSTIPVLLLLPFSASILISKSFPTSSKFCLFLTNSFSHSFFDSILITPFALSTFLIAKAYIIQALNHHYHHHGPSLPPFSPCLSLYKPLLQTHLCNMVLSIAASMVIAIFVLITASGFLHGLLQLVTRIVLYAFVTNIIVLCNLALVVAGMENCSGYRAIYRAYLLRRSGTNSMALFLLAIPTQLGLASIKALFWYRLVRAYDQLGGRSNFGMALEGLLIAYLYSIVIVLDTIACWCFSRAANQIAHAKCLQILVFR